MDEYAIIEQMGHRRFGARIREVDFCGVKLLEATTLTEPPLTQRIHPQSLYALTGCTEEQARSACGRWSLPSDLQRMLPEPVAEQPPPEPAEERNTIELVFAPEVQDDDLQEAVSLLSDLLSDERDKPAYTLAAAIVQQLRDALGTPARSLNDDDDSTDMEIF